MLEGDAEGAAEAMRVHIASAKAIATMVYKIEL
jgi:DNA-binding GntR family transcriptional regulator